MSTHLRDNRLPVPDSKLIELVNVTPRLTQTEIARECGISKAAVSKRLKKLGLNHDALKARRDKDDKGVIREIVNRSLPESHRRVEPPKVDPKVQAMEAVTSERGLMEQLISLRGSIDKQTIMLSIAEDEIDAALPRLKIMGMREASVALKNMAQISDTTMQIHDLWAESSMSTLSSFAQRVIQRLAKSGDIDNIRAVVHDEYSNAKDTMAKQYRDVNPVGVNR